MANEVHIYDCAPSYGETYRFVKTPKGFGLLVPFVSFEAYYGETLNTARKRSMVTGVIPMALIYPSIPAVVMESAMYTHATRFTEFLDNLIMAERNGYTPKGTHLMATQDIIYGDYNDVPPSYPDIDIDNA